MASYTGNGSVYVCNLPSGTDEDMLAEYFGTIGLLKKDKRTGKPKIWLYLDKVTNEPKGDATITYEDPHAALAAIEWFNNKDFNGATIGVFMAESKHNKDDQFYPENNNTSVDPLSNVIEQEDGLINTNEEAGKVDALGKPWQQDGDWVCTNTSCGNVNFAFRGVCNRCGTERPGRGGGGGGSSVRGRGGQTRAVGGLFSPNDWACPMCANINWAKRSKCNVCNTNKPGVNEGDVRGGRGGGYKELDEVEIEETRRRRREAEEDDGEMYDEFGILKKKFRAKKAHQVEAGVGVGRAGWEVEELGMSERKRRERGNEERHQSSKSREQRENEYDRRERDRDYDRGERRRYR